MSQSSPLQPSILSLKQSANGRQHSHRVNQSTSSYIVCRRGELIGKQKKQNKARPIAKAKARQKIVRRSELLDNGFTKLLAQR